MNGGDVKCSVAHRRTDDNMLSDTREPDSLLLLFVLLNSTV